MAEDDPAGLVYVEGLDSRMYFSKLLGVILWEMYM